MERSMFNEMDHGIRTTCVDLANLMTWAHTHGTICSQMPTMENVQRVRSRQGDNTVLWICAAGHAYKWSSQGAVFGRVEDPEDMAERNKRRTSYGMWQGEHATPAKKYKLASEGQNLRSCSKSSGAGPGSENDMLYVVCNATSLQDHLNGLQLRQKSCEMGPGGICPYSAPTLHCQYAPRYRKPSLEVGASDHQQVKEEVTGGDICETDEEGQISQATGNTTGDSWSKDLYSEGEQQELEQSQGGAPVIATCSTDLVHSVSSSPLALVHKPSGDEVAKESGGFIEPDGTSLSPGSYSHSEPISIMSTPQDTTSAEQPTTESLNEFQSLISRQSDHLIVEGESETSQNGLEVTCHVPCYDNSSDTMPELVALSPTETGAVDGTQVGTADQAPERPRNAGTLASEIKMTETSMVWASQKKPPKRTETKKAGTFADIKLFRDWLSMNYPEEQREVQALPPQQLDRYLSSFYLKIRKMNGLEFSANSFLFFQTSIERYLREQRYGHSIVRGAQFSMSQEALRHKYQQLLQKERERDWSIVKKLTDKDVETLRRKGLLSRLHPEGLLNLLFVNNIRGFGVRRQLQGTALSWGHISLKRMPDGSECLEWKGSQTGDLGLEEPAPCVYSKPGDPENCPVLDYQEYARRRPLDMAFDTAPFYLSPKPLYCLWDQTWYCRKPLAKAKLSKIMKTIIHQVKQSNAKLK
ncbi:uncharacterized protein KIAA1958-like [Lissotriton helveticus]